MNQNIFYSLFYFYLATQRSKRRYRACQAGDLGPPLQQNRHLATSHHQGAHKERQGLRSKTGSQRACQQVLFDDVDGDNDDRNRDFVFIG